MIGPGNRACELAPGLSPQGQSTITSPLPDRGQAFAQRWVWVFKSREGGGTQKPVGNDWSTAASFLRRSTQGACPPHPRPSRPQHPPPCASTHPIRKHQGRCLGLSRVTKGVRKGGVPPFSHKDRKSFDFCFGPFHYTHATLTREL